MDQLIYPYIYIAQKGITFIFTPTNMLLLINLCPTGPVGEVPSLGHSLNLEHL